MKRPALVLAAALACAIAAGSESFGRLALSLGAPRLALPLLTDPGARGLALFRSGDYAAADAAFAQAGRSQTFNRGLSLAATGNYPLSLAYFDAVLFAHPDDAEARRLRDLVATMVTPVRGESVAPGRLKATGGRASACVGEQVRAGAPDPEWQKPLEVRALAASDDWLATITDDPGTFLRLRLRAEYDRRTALGLIRPDEVAP